MVETLYDKLDDFESLACSFNEIFNGLPVSESYLKLLHEGDLKFQKRIISDYENNPVLNDAVEGRQSISDSLSELAQINKGWKVMLPRRKNKAHNERIEQMGELISEPSGLITRGLFYPDNAVSLTCYTAVALTILEKVLLNYDLLVGNNPIEIAKSLRDFAKTSVVGSIGMGLICGWSDNERTTKLPFGQAQYLDEKILELYK